MTTENKQPPEITEAFICDCYFPEHFILVEYRDWSWNMKEFHGMQEHITIQPALCTEGFFGRIKQAIKYVFTGNAHMFAEVMLNLESATRLRNVLNTYIAWETSKNG